MVITNNILSANAQRMYKLNVDERAKNVKKLSSGYRINMAADDAAGVTISEKMREQIRGLNQGTENAKSGISWVQTGDGALGEVQDIIHRMRELTIQSLNDTNTAQDRAALQAEFDELQSEIDRISKTTQFNQKDIFSEHEPEYYQIEGNRYWEQNNIHTVDSSMNTLTVQYKQDSKSSAASEVTITVPEGVYTTQELIDEIDDALIASGGSKAGLIFEYTDKGTCNLNYEGGEQIEGISGGLSYLINDLYTGGSVGALIGTTIFNSDYNTLEIVTGKNDNMSFEIQDFDGNVKTKSLTIPQGEYTRQQIIDLLNNNLADTTVKAVKYSTGIKLKSDDSIITGFKGNMFKIEKQGETIYTSVFYDNVMYGAASMSAAEFKGGAVLPAGTRDAQHNHYVIDDSNNMLTLSVNGESQTSIQLNNGEYTTSEMSDALNKLFQDNGIDAVAQEYSSGSFLGLKITSSLKGSKSSITIDKNSSAYNTLFINRSYNVYSDDASLVNETKPDSAPYVTGGKRWDSGTLPLKVGSGNNQFKISLDGTAYTIKLTSGTYNTANDIRDELDKQLNGAGAKAGYKNKLDVSIDYYGRIVLKGKEGSRLKSVDVSAVSKNSGFKDLFVGEQVSYKTTTVSNKGTSTKPAKITLNTPVKDPAAIDSSDNKLTVNVNGSNKTVVIPTGNKVTHKDIIDSINKQLEEKTVTVTNTFPAINVSGRESIKSVTAYGKGSTSTASKTYTARGSSDKVQGETGTKNNVGAKVTLAVALPETTAVTDENNILRLSINGVEETITLDNGKYTADALKNQLQKKIDAAFGKSAGGAVVSLSDSKLVFTARIKHPDNTEMDGAKTSIEMGTGSSSFLKELHTTRTSASAITSAALAPSIKIGEGQRQFSFEYTDGSGTKQVNLKLDTGTYTPATLAEEINEKLAAQKIGVNASVASGKLKLVTEGKGSEYSINYTSAGGGSSSAVIFGQLDSASAAFAIADCAIQSSIKIEDATNGFSMNVNGKNINLKLDNGTYTRDSFVKMLNNKFKQAGAGVTAGLSGNKLTYTTDLKGNKASISMSYNTGGTSMFPIYGETKSIQQGVKASFNKSNKLVLTGTQNGGSLSVTSDSGGIFQSDEKEVTEVDKQAVSGYASDKHSYIDGVNMTEPVTIDKWNKNLGFVYYDNGTNHNVDITLEEKTYTFSELKNALVKKLEAAVGTGKLNVSVGGTGVKIECAGTGSSYRMGSFSGGFYDKVMCSFGERRDTVTVSGKAGGQRVDSAFTIGRRDIKNSDVSIERGVNDEFAFDFTYGSTAHAISLKIKEGTYSGEDLAKEIQGKLSAELKKLGLSENLITAGIGGVSTDVSGSNDSNALCLKLSEDEVLPAEGEYIIDGVRGNAAFYIFYQSDGNMRSAYIKGSKDITKGARITDENNKLSFEVDGDEKEITLDKGNYSCDELIDELNNKLEAAGVSISAKMDGKNLKLVHKQFGEHAIDHITGTAKNTLFFQENEGDGKSKDIRLQLSGDAGDEEKGLDKDNEAVGRDYVSIERPIVNTAYLGINSIVITKPKYADKALNRLEKALDKVSEVRSMFGSVQNRLEHAVFNNDNTEENTTSAESLIRDTDMAAEMVLYSKNSILQQASQAMIAQANSNMQAALALLKSF